MAQPLIVPTAPKLESQKDSEEVRKSLLDLASKINEAILGTGREISNEALTADQKAALAGTDGTPSATNPYVTDSDPRLSSSTERIYVFAHGSGTTTVGNNVIIPEVIDTQGAWSGTVFTPPRESDYIISGRFSPVNLSTGTPASRITMYIAGVSFEDLTGIMAQNTQAYSADRMYSFALILHLTTSDTVSFKVSDNTFYGSSKTFLCIRNII